MNFSLFFIIDNLLLFFGLINLGYSCIYHIILMFLFIFVFMFILYLYFYHCKALRTLCIGVV